MAATRAGRKNEKSVAPGDGRYLDAKEAAEILGLRPSWVRQMAATGRLSDSYKKAGAWWISEEQVYDRLRNGGDRPGVKYVRPPALEGISDRQVENVIKRADADDLSGSRSVNDDLDERERLVLVLRLGLQEEERHTLDDIAGKLSLSREMVRRIERQAAEKVRDARKKRRGGRVNRVEDVKSTGDRPGSRRKPSLA